MRRQSIMVSQNELIQNNLGGSKSPTTSSRAQSPKKVLITKKSQDQPQNSNPSQNQPLTSNIQNASPQDEKIRKLATILIRKQRQRISDQNLKFNQEQLKFQEQQNHQDLFKEYQLLKKLSQQKPTFSTFIDGKQANRLLSQVKHIVQMTKEDNQVLKQIDKTLALNLKEACIQYEIAMEMKKSECQEMREQRLEEFQKINKEKSQIQNKISKIKQARFQLNKELKQIEQDLVQEQSIANIFTPPQKSFMKSGSMPYLNTISFNPTQQNEIDQQPAHVKQLQIKKIIKELESKRQDCEDDLEDLSSDFEELVEEEKQLLNQIAFLDKEISQLHKKQVQHYIEAFQIGLDSRDDGLSWVIETLWQLSEVQIDLKTFPPFLNDKCKEFLLDYARLNCELRSLHYDLKQKLIENRKTRNTLLLTTNNQNEDLKLNEPAGFLKRMGTLYNRTVENKKQQSMDKYERIRAYVQNQNKIQERIKEKIKKISSNTQKESIKQVKESDKIFFKMLRDDFFEEKFEEDSFFIDQQQQINNQLIIRPQSPQLKIKLQRQEDYKKVLTLENSLIQTRQRMKTLRDQISQYLIQEYYSNGYEKKYKVTIDVILNALMGQSKAQKVMKGMAVRVEQMRQAIEQGKTFYFSALKTNRHGFTNGGGDGTNQ
eukprot:403337782